RIRVPFSDALATLDLIAFIDLDPGAVLDAMQRPLSPVLIDDDDDHVARHGDRLAIRVALYCPVADADRAIEVGLDERLLGDLRSAADVERAHGELRSGFADRLSGDDPDRFTHVHRRARRQVASVAPAAHAVRKLASEHRTNAQLLDAGVDDFLDLLLLDQRAARNDDPVRCRFAHILSGGASENAARQR